MKIVCVFAHPDDEAFLTGGTIATFAKEHDIFLICCTDGNHQEKNLKSIRAVELEKSSEILGVKKVYQLNYHDGGLCNANYHALAADVRSILDGIQPDRLITFHPNGVSGHLDHIAVTSVVNYVFEKVSYVKELWYFTSVAEPNPQKQDYFVYRPEGVPRENIDQIIDVSPVWAQIKSAISAHKSQAEDGDQVVDKYENGPKEEYFLVRKK